MSDYISNAVIGGITIPYVIDYSNVTYPIGTVASASGSLAVTGANPITVITVTGDVTSVALDSTATYQLGHSYHVVFVSGSNDSTEHTVEMTSTTASGIQYICPSSDGVELTVPTNAGGYVEVDFLCIGVPVSGSGNYVFLVRGV